MVARPAYFQALPHGEASHQSWGGRVRGFLLARSNRAGGQNPVDDLTRNEERPIVFLRRHLRRENFFDHFARDRVRPAGGDVASFDSCHESDLDVRGQNSCQGAAEVEFFLASRANYLDRMAKGLGNSSRGSFDLGQRSCRARGLEHGQNLARGSLGHDRQSCEASYLGEIVMARLAHAVHEPKVGWPGYDRCGNYEPKVDRPDHGNHAPTAVLHGHDRGQPGTDQVLDVRGCLDRLANGDPPKVLAFEVVQRMGHVVRAVVR